MIVYVIKAAVVVLVLSCVAYWIGYGLSKLMNRKK